MESDPIAAEGVAAEAMVVEVSDGNARDSSVPEQQNRGGEDAVQEEKEEQESELEGKEQNIDSDARGTEQGESALSAAHEAEPVTQPVETQNTSPARRPSSDGGAPVQSGDIDESPAADDPIEKQEPVVETDDVESALAEQGAAGGEEEEEDDHNYEITDFSMVTPWERLIQDIEDILLNWGLDKGRTGSGWDGKFAPTREHTVLNSSQTKGVRHRCEKLAYRGGKFLLRHVEWLPEGQIEGAAGVCGVEQIWRKRSSAATSSDYVLELGCGLGLANYVILSPDKAEGTGFLGGTTYTHIALQDCTILRSALAIAQRNVGCTLAGFTPTGPRATPTATADYPYTFQGLQTRALRVTRHCCYLDAQATRETADSMRTPHGAVQYMRGRHCRAGDSVTISVRDTHYLVEEGVPAVDSARSTLAGSMRGSWGAAASLSVSDFAWGASSEPMQRLTLELTWENLPEEAVPKSPLDAITSGKRCGLPLESASHMSVACQFTDDLPCPLAEALERLCELLLEAHQTPSFAEVWEPDDPIRQVFKKGVDMVREGAPPSVERIAQALEDCLPSDPDGYTVNGECVSTYIPSQSESEASRGLRIKAAPPGSLLALLARHVADEQIAKSLRYVSLLWSEFVSEVRWFWDHSIVIPRLPVSGGLLDMDCCLIHQKLQLINVCIRKRQEASTNPAVDVGDEEFDLHLIRESELSSLLMTGGDSHSELQSENTDGSLDAANRSQPELSSDAPHHTAISEGEEDSPSRAGERAGQTADACEAEQSHRTASESKVDSTTKGSERTTEVALSSGRESGSQVQVEGGQDDTAWDEDGVVKCHAPVTPTRHSTSSAHHHHHHHQSSQPSNAAWPAGNVGPWPGSPSAPRTPSGGHAHRSRTPSTMSLSSRGGSALSPTERSRRNSDSVPAPEAITTQIGTEHAAEGVKGAVKGLFLLHTGEILNEPLTQDHPLLTEDRLEEQQQLMMNATPSSRGSAIRAKLSGGLRALKSDMAAFQAANPGSSLEDFVRWYSPRDWQEDDADQPAGREAAGDARPRVRGRLSGRMSAAGNAWVECWRSVIPVPAHKQKKLFDFEKEAERALHDLENLSPSGLLSQLLNCAFMAAFHTLHSAVDSSQVPSVGVVLSRVKHFVWCGEDLGRPLDEEHCSELCTAFALAERQVTKASSAMSKLNFGAGGLVDMLCTTGRANVTHDDEKEQLLSLACGGASQLKLRSADDLLGRPQAREYVCRAHGSLPRASQLLFVRTAPDLFRIATSSTTPAV